MPRRLPCVFTALVLLLQFPFAASPAAAQAGGFLVGYEGTLTLSNAPAPAGTLIRAVAVHSWSDMLDCGQAQVGTQGHYILRVTVRDCITPDMNHQAIEHYFVVNGENVGHTQPSAWLNLPSTLGHVLQTGLHGTALPSRQGSSPSTMVLIRYIGTLRLAGALASLGTAVTISSALTGSDAAAACGSGQVIDDQGLYVVDVQNPLCITPDMNHRPIDHYFVVNGENVGHTEPSAWLNLTHTLGKVLSVGLRGTGPPPGDVFSSGPTPQPIGQAPAAQPQPEPATPPSPPSDQQPGGQEMRPRQPDEGTPPDPQLGQPAQSTEPAQPEDAMVCYPDAPATDGTELVAAGQPSCQPLERMKITGDSEFRRQVVACLSRFLVLRAQSPHLDALLQAFEEPVPTVGPDAGAIAEVKANGAFQEGSTPFLDGWAADHVPQNVTIYVNPSLPYGAAGMLNPLGLSIGPSFCYSLLHEMSHAREYMWGKGQYTRQSDGTPVPIVRHLTGGDVPATEVTASTEANRFAILTGLDPVRQYCLRTNPAELSSVKCIDLPPEAWDPKQISL